MTSALHHALALVLRLLARPGGAQIVAMVLISLVITADAEARVGGGQRYSRPSSGGSRSGSGSGYSGGGDANLIYLLIQLVIQVPAIGVPLLVMVVGYFVYQAYHNSSGRVVHRTHAPSSSPRRAPPTPGLAALRKTDPGFSVPVFLDFAALIHRRAIEASLSGRTEPLAPFVSPEAVEQLKSAHRGVTRVDDLVVGGVRLGRISREGDMMRAEVIFENTRTEHLQSGSREVVVHERWTFQRAANAASLPPADVERLGCPSCGAAIDVDALGACRNCQTPITAGQLQWQVVAMELGHRGKASAPEVGLLAGGDEGSLAVPIIQAADLQAEARRLLARHPTLSLEAFGQRVSLTYFRLQEAWSAGRWSDARPYVTDAQYQSMRFWMDRYQKHGLANRLTDIQLEQTSIVKIEVDAWYESITVRIIGSMKDTVVMTSTDKVVGGNPNVARRFAEYWTFLRAGGTDGSTKGDAQGCPSCGAPLDRISQAGVCGYCDSRITTGQFDWVLARIEQPEAYGG